MRSHAKWVRRNVLKFRRYKLGMQSRRSRMDRFIKSKIDADVNRRLRYQREKKHCWIINRKCGLNSFGNNKLEMRHVLL